jgi:subtilisin family serine protease
LSSCCAINFRAMPDTAMHAAARSADVAGAQAPLLHSVEAAGGTVTRRYHLLDAFAATVSPTEQAALARDPAVSAVYPNVTFRIAEPQQVSPSVSSSVALRSDAVAPLTAAPQTGSVVCGTAADPLLEPEALQLTHTAPSTVNGSTAGTEMSSGITGAGVKVGVIGDGLDPDNPDLMRNGSSIVTEVDFTGTGVDGPSPGGEAFADAGSIAAQGNMTYDLSQRVPGNSQLGPGCDMRIRGMAPGATLFDLKAFGAGDNSTTEDLVAAIDYAVSTAHVNVLNESFGSGNLPDDVQDAVRQADEQAYAAGVTVVAATGDVGPFNTQISPSTDPDVIAAAGSTSNRVDAQLGNYGAGLMTLGEGFQGGTTAAPDGWLDNSPAGFSSSGIDQTGGVPDVIAPSDQWILCSTNSAVFTGCSTTETEFIGTSNASPLTAGAAALVIQAYAQTHGSDPSPALVKQILMSTADDTGAPSEEQGAGLLDTFAAVQAAESPSVGVGAGSSRAQTGVLVSTSSNVANPDPGGPRPGQIDLSASAGTSTSATIGVTNTGSSTEIVTPTLRGLASTLLHTNGQVTLDGPSPSSQPTFKFGDGSTHRYQSWTFTLPSGTSELREQASWVGQQSSVQVSLFDPSGRYAGTTNLSNEGLLDVAQPQAGTWTGVAFTGTGSHSYNGPVDFSTTASAFTTPAAVSPAALTLAPGAHGSFTVPLTLPTGAGDENEDVTVSTALAGAPGVTLSTDVVPVALRALVALSAGGEGTFSGTAEGDGLGTFGPTGDTPAPNGVATYNFDVPAGAPALTVGVTVPGNTTTPMSGYLIDPQGERLSTSDNAIADADGTVSGYRATVQNVVLAPQAGLWRYVVGVTVPAGGGADEGTYNGTVTLSSPDAVTTANVPQSTSTFVAPGATTQATIDVVNGGATNQLVFADPRSQALAQVPLAVHYVAGDSVALPFTGADPPVSFLVPPDTTALTASTRALTAGGQPLAGAAFDFVLNGGNPDIGSNVSDAASGTSTATLGVNPPLPQIAQGEWLLTPSLDGPFGTAATVPSGTATASVLADTLGFDTSVTGSTGDYWLKTINSGASAAGLSLAPGAGGQISVSFTPSASTPVGTVVSGTLYIDDYFNDLQSGDQLAAVPYTYTVGTAPTTPPPATTPTPPSRGPPVTPPPVSPQPKRAAATGVRSTAKKLSTGVAALRLPLSATCASSSRSPPPRTRSRSPTRPKDRPRSAPRPRSPGAPARPRPAIRCGSAPPAGPGACSNQGG